MATTATEIQALYVAYFNRPADYFGLPFWQAKADAAGGAAKIANLFANSDEYKATYGGKSNAEIVDALYVNLFGRHAETEGLIYWANKLNTGALGVGDVAFTILNSAQNADKIAITSKIAAATAFTAAVDTTAEIIGYSGAAANQVAKDWLSTITTDAALQAAIKSPATINAVINSAVVAHDGGTNIGTTFTLTDKADTFVGGTGRDTFNGDNATLTATDSIDGGAGIDTLTYTDASAIATGLVPTALVKNVEIINIRNANSSGALEVATSTMAALTNGQTLTIAGRTITAGAGGATAAEVAAAFATGTSSANATVSGALAGYTAAAGAGTAVVFTATATGNVTDLAATGTGAAAATIVVGTQGNAPVDTVDATNFAGATDFNSFNSTNGVSFTGLSAGQNVGLIGNGALTNGSLTATYASGTSAALNLSGATSGAVSITGGTLATLTVNADATGNGITSLTTGATALVINAAASTNLGVITDAALKTVTVSGAAGTVTLGTLASTALTSVDASALTGGVVAGIGANAATTFKGGAGADTVTIAAGAVMTGTVDGGAGTDILSISTTASLSAVTGKLFTNFETLQVSSAAGTQTFDPTQIAGITSYRVVAGAGTVALTNLLPAAAVTAYGTGTITGLELNVKDAVTGLDDVVNLTLNNNRTSASAANNGSTIGTLKAVGIETLNIHSNGLVNNGGAAYTVNNDAVSNTSLGKVNIDGSAAVNFVTGAITKITTVDASTATGHVTVTGTAAGLQLNVNGGTSNDSIFAGTVGGSLTGNAGGDSITLGAGVDQLVFKAAGDSLQDFTGVAGAALTAAGKMDNISGFVSGTDKIDLTSLNFTTATTKVVVDKTYASTDLLATAEAAATFYQDAANIVRGAVVAHVAGDTFLVVDANHDGVFNAASDLVVKFVGTTTVVQGDIIFG